MRVDNIYFNSPISGTIGSDYKVKRNSDFNSSSFPCTTAPVSRTNTDDIGGLLYHSNQDMKSENKSLLNGSRRIFSSASNDFKIDDEQF
jgi:hypothetical protein